MKKIFKMPWKEVMLGEGLLNIAFGASGLVAANLFSDSAYNFFQNLSRSQMKILLVLISKGVISLGLLSVAVPLLFIAVTGFIQRNQKSL